ncbi:AraC family transcriptional regulator [Chryseobacterium indoltheticum]|uniref:AraC family transcriptional regulator n=1 Tax=Chryseobacterium indoltheticum TaxID=254 RepID=UPI001911275F|nr:AraC family transcriptional regulator [Chryseobacterium indoltheticum]QQQ28927.1 helix-turn-helix transcriptional regulator [Chryseobacterium indoltheticum]
MEQGEKVVFYSGSKITITDDHFVILSSGNCLMTEKLPVNSSYCSTMLSFDNEALMNFFIKYASFIKEKSRSPAKEIKPFLVLEKDDIIKNYIASIKLLHSKQMLISDHVLAVKFEELMLYLLEKYPNEILSFQTKNQESYSDFEIRKAVEMNLTNNLTLEELAFLCHTSISTFKRKFLKIYSDTPSKYFLRQKMKMAQLLLMQNQNPSEVFYKVGYESHSSFSQSFKQTYGMSPREFQEKKMIGYQQLMND